MHRITNEIIQQVNLARKGAGKPMLSRKGFEAAAARVRTDDTNETLVSTLVSYEIASALMADYSSSYEVPLEGGGGTASGAAPLQGEAAGAGAGALSEQQTAQQQQAGERA